MKPRHHLWIARLGLIVLVVLHLDFWRPVRSGRIGWMPEELAYRLGWMFLALLYLLHFCTKVWKSEGEGE